MCVYKKMSETKDCIESLNVELKDEEFKHRRVHVTKIKPIALELVTDYNILVVSTMCETVVEQLKQLKLQSKVNHVLITYITSKIIKHEPSFKDICKNRTAKENLIDIFECLERILNEKGITTLLIITFIIYMCSR